MLDTASPIGKIDVLSLTRTELETWLSKQDAMSHVDKAAFAKKVADTFLNSGQPEKAYEFSRTYVRLLPASTPDSEAAALDLITTALNLPSVLDFDPLLKLNAVVALKDHELFSLLHIFMNDGLLAYQSWVQSHPDVFEKYNLDKTQLEHKIRLLTLASLGFDHIGQDLSYSKIVESLQIDISDVEKWVIDVIRAGILWGKLSQTNQTLRIIRSIARRFEKEQWEMLERRILAWKTGLTGILDVVASAKRQAGIAPALVA
ncbi:hypothetical protein AMATHDRAFT_59429 [Amanita thiersii Skay4041]|uniref:PCI domain-containing protein n=1 Tax=Amanita thiersii Skay4041 TaxID=703135 RepID=A0A2A9NSW1_9AGAR|nr:hypothetical protein AMATHDRAFT_59429 [Amanita thiersii Skay4041]